MPGITRAAALPNKANEVLQTSSRGLLRLLITVLDAVDCVPSLYRLDKGKLVHAIGDVKVPSEAVDDGSILQQRPVVPGSLKLVASGCPTLVDRDSNGVLRIQREVGAKLAYGDNGVTGAYGTHQITCAGADFVAAGAVAGDQLVLGGRESGSYTLLTVTTTVLTATTPFKVGGLTDVEFFVYAQDPVCGKFDYFSGLLKLAYPTSPTSAVPAPRGTVLGTGVFPINLDPGMKLNVDIDAGGGLDATFNAARAVLAGSGGTFAAMLNETMNVQFENGEVQPVVFTTEAALQDAVDAINVQLVGGYASINAGQVDLHSDAMGTAARVRTSGVAAGITTKLGIPNTGSSYGTGNVADINAVLFAEFKTIVELAVANSLATLDPTGHPRLSSSSTNTGLASKVQCGGTARTKFGFDALLHTGADPGAQVPVTASYYKTMLVKGRTELQVTNQGQLSLRLAGKGNSAMVQIETVGQPG